MRKNLNSDDADTNANKQELIDWSSNDKTPAKTISNLSNDLFQAHNFEIDINLAVPITRECLLIVKHYVFLTNIYSIVSTTVENNLQPLSIDKTITKSANSLSRRWLNLEEYKKKKGLF